MCVGVGGTLADLIFSHFLSLFLSFFEMALFSNKHMCGGGEVEGKGLCLFIVFLFYPSLLKMAQYRLNIFFTICGGGGGGQDTNYMVIIRL